LSSKKKKDYKVREKKRGSLGKRKGTWIPLSRKGNLGESCIREEKGSATRGENRKVIPQPFPGIWAKETGKKHPKGKDLTSPDV